MIITSHWSFKEGRGQKVEKTDVWNSCRILEKLTFVGAQVYSQGWDEPFLFQGVVTHNTNKRETWNEQVETSEKDGEQRPAQLIYDGE